LRVAAQNLQIGQSMRLPDGTEIRFDGYQQWASLQVSHDPTQAPLLVAAVLMVLGLLGSLAVRRRRLWVRITPQDGGLGNIGGLSSLVAVGGLARNDSGNFPAEFQQVLATLQGELGCAGAAAGAAGPPELPASPMVDRIGAGKD
jgi:cytochrome c biogenesis protein